VPFFLWGFFPPIGGVDLRDYKNKESYSSEASAQRAKVPYTLSAAVADAIELQPALLEA